MGQSLTETERRKVIERLDKLERLGIADQGCGMRRVIRRIDAAHRRRRKDVRRYLCILESEQRSRFVGAARSAAGKHHRDSAFFWLAKVLREGVLGCKLLHESVGDILAGGVEGSSIEARPLVRVYSRRQLRRMMSATGFRDVPRRSQWTARI